MAVAFWPVGAAAAGVAVLRVAAAGGAVLAAGAPGQVLPGHWATGVMGRLVEAVWNLSDEPAAEATFRTSWEAARQREARQGEA